MITIKSFEFNYFQENTFLLYDDTHEAVLIDCGCCRKEEEKELTDFILENKLTLKHLLCTHLHVDHVFGNGFINIFHTRCPLFDYLKPSLRSLDAAHLDAGQCFIKLLCDRTHGFHTAWQADFLTMINNLSNWRDNGCCSAKTTLCKIFNLIKVYRTLLNLKS